MKKKKKASETTQKKQKIKKQAKSGFADSWLFDLLAIGLIVILGLIIYSNAFNCSFHLDDGLSIVDNASIRDLSNIDRIWSAGPTRFTTYYTFALNYHFGALDVWGYHLVNLIIHLVNACLIYFLTMLLFSSSALKDKEIAKNKKWIALFTALLFVSHPLATQSVTYIVQRIASLVTMFYLFSLVLYIKARVSAQRGIVNYLLFGGAIVFAGLAMLTKENAFTLPMAVLLVEVCFLNKKQFAIDFKDYRVIALVIAFIGTMIIIPLNFSFNIFQTIPPELGNTYSVTPLNYLFTQFSVIVKYIQLLILPVNLNLDYDFPISNSLFELRTIGSLLLLIGIAVVGMLSFKKNRIFTFGIFWFFLTLAVESSIIPLSDLIFEHRTYLPSYGFFLILSTGVFVLFWKKSKYLVLGLLTLIIGINAVLAHQRNEVWLNDLTLWTDITKKSPNKARPFGTLGDYYLGQQAWDEALVNYNTAIKNNPEYAIALHNRASVYGKLGNQELSIADYSRAIEIDPNYILAYYNRGNTYSKLFRWDEAIADYTKAIALNQNFEQAYYARSLAYTKLFEWDQAIADCTRAIALKKNNSAAYFNRGYSYYKKGDYNTAITDYNLALAQDPANANLYLNRGIAYDYLGKWDTAIADYSKALELNPNLTAAYNNRENVYLRTGQKK